MKAPKKATEAFFYTLIFLMTVAIAWGDELSGFEVRLFVFYYLPIALAAWRGGKIAGILASIVALFGWGYSNFNLTAQTPFVRYWNAGVVLAAFLTVAFPMAWIGREVRYLRQLLPICAWCKKIRDDSGYWEQVEKYLQRRNKTELTHACCPECAERFRKPVVLHADENPEEIFLFKDAVTKANLPHRLYSIPQGSSMKDWLSGSHEFSNREKFPLPDVLLVGFNGSADKSLLLLEWIQNRKDLKDIPVLVVGSSDEPENIKKVYDFGATSFFSKSSNYVEVTEFLKSSSHGHNH